MDYAELYQKEWAEFQAHTRRKRGLKTPAPQSTLERWTRHVVRFFRRTPELPEDPYAYAMAPKKPRYAPAAEPRLGRASGLEPHSEPTQKARTIFS